MSQYKGYLKMLKQKKKSSPEILQRVTNLSLFKEISDLRRVKTGIFYVEDVKKLSQE